MARTYMVRFINLLNGGGTYKFSDLNAMNEYVVLARNTKWGI